MDALKGLTVKKKYREYFMLSVIVTSELSITRISLFIFLPFYV
jgi:hypothetical protein